MKRTKNQFNVLTNALELYYVKNFMAFKMKGLPF